MESVGGREAKAGGPRHCVWSLDDSTHQVLAVVVHAVGRAAEGEVGIVVIRDLRLRGGELVHLWGCWGWGGDDSWVG